jgi:RNA polymerase sigma-70 factor (ECF subfamily)
MSEPLGTPSDTAQRGDARPVRPAPAEDDPILALVVQIQEGIRLEENFEKLFLRFRPAVRFFFARRGFSTEECKDLTQDVFLRVFNGIDTFQRKSRFERWLWEITAHVYCNELRRRKTEKRNGIERSLDAANESDPSPPLEIMTDEPSPEDEIIRRELRGILRSALHELPDQMRRCCILRYEQGRKYQEIADTMKISIETVKAHLHQARKRLLDRLGDGDTGGKKGSGA